MLRRGDFAAALRRVEPGYRKWGERLDTPMGWRFRVVKAEALSVQSRGAETLRLLEPTPPARAEFREVAVRRLMAQSRARQEAGEFDRATRLVEEARRLAAEWNLRSLALAIEYQTGLLLAAQSEYEAADQRLRGAQEEAARQGDQYVEAGALGGLCFSLLRRGRYDEALPWCERSAAIARKIGARANETAAVGNSGRCYWGIGEYEKAQTLLAQAAELTGQMGDLRRRQSWLRALGDVMKARGDRRGATRIYEEALALSQRIETRETTAALHNQLASEALEAGDLSAAERHNQEALRLARSSGYRSILTAARFTAGQVHAARGDAKGAETAFRETLAAASDSEDPGYQWLAHSELAKLRAAAGDDGTAAREYETALAVLERSRARLARDEWKLAFQSASRRLYADYVDFLMDRGETAHALEVVEWSRARVLAQKLGALDATPDVHTIQHFQAIARRRKAALVSVWLGEKRSYGWVATCKEVTSIRLPAEAEITSWVAAFNASIQGLRDPLESGHPAGRRLSEALLAPLERHLLPTSRVILVPDGALHQLNLEALPAPSGRARYWIEDVTVEIAPSLALLPAGKARVAGGTRSLLLVGAPLPSPGFKPLPGVEQEVAAVAGRFRNPVTLTGAAAHPAAYREAGPGRFTFIHFAAHALANRENPLESAVVLSPGGNGSRLYAREALAWPLKARLVTISACRGAGSRVYSGEGLVGFAWAFLQAGARNVIAGLWDVNDKSTALLMDRLYAEIAAGRPPAAALRAAKLELLASRGAYRKPYYWAPFEAFTRYPE